MFFFWLLSDITVHYCSLDARKLKLNTAYNCSVELTGKLNSLNFVINIFLSITRTAGNTPGTKTATLQTLGSFSNDDGDFNGNGKKENNRLRLAKQQLYPCITLFCTFLCRYCTTASWNSLISCFVEDVNRSQRLSFSFPELRYSLLEFNSRKISQHLTNSTAME